MKKVLLYACVAMLPSTYAAAEGYQVNIQSTKQAGMGHVGAALKLGSESMHFNPAGLGFLENNVDFSVGMAGIFSKFTYHSTTSDYTHKSDNKPSTPLYAYAGFKVYDNFAVGVSLTTPYGSAMNWGKNWAGSQLIQDIALKSFSIQPTVAYRPFERLSIGAGAMLMFGNFSLSRALIPAGGLEGLRQLSPLFPDLGQKLDKYKNTTAVSATLGGDANIRVGFNVGAMYDINDQFTVGVSYRSKVNLKVNEGLAELTYANKTELEALFEQVNPYLPAEKKINIPALDEGTFKAQLPLPSNFNVGLTYKPNTDWTLSGEVQFVGWGAYKSLNVEFYPREVLGEHDINAKKEYINTRIYRLGAEYAATQRLDLRLGAYLDESPVQELFLNPETPSMDKLGLTTGLTFQATQRFSIDFAFNYVTGFGRIGSYPTGKDTRFEGDYDVRAYNLVLGMSYKF